MYHFQAAFGYRLQAKVSEKEELARKLEKLRKEQALAREVTNEERALRAEQQRAANEVCGLAFAKQVAEPC